MLDARHLFIYPAPSQQFYLYIEPYFPTASKVFFYRFFFVIFFKSSGGWGKIKLKLTTLPRISINVVCRFNPIAFAIQR